jgi:hypothetical protein
VDTVIEPLSTTRDDGPGFEPVTVYQWFGRHLTKSYKERKHTTVPAAAEAFVAKLQETR